MPKKNNNPRKKKTKEEINDVKKKIEEVASDYRKYLIQMGGVAPKDLKVSPGFMNDIPDAVKAKKKDKHVYEVPLVDMEDGPLGTMMDSLPNDQLKNKFFEIIESHGLRFNLDDGTIELLIYN